MRIHESVAELIGNTPLLELKNFERNHDLAARIVGKVEFVNPAGSIKDRIAKFGDKLYLEFGGRAPSSSSRRRATPASGWLPCAPRAATASSSACPTRCRSNAAISCGHTVPSSSSPRARKA